MNAETALRSRTAALTLILGAALVAAFPSAARAATLTQHVYGTGGIGLYLHPGAPTLASATSPNLMADGTEFDVSCYAAGDDVLGDTIWDFGTNATTGEAGYAADYYIDTPVTQGQEAAQLAAMGVPACGPPALAPASVPLAPLVAFDRSATSNWAVANLATPESFPNDDCTWFVSQALWAGGLPQSPAWTGDSWDWNLVASNYHYPGPTRDAAQANDLVNYLTAAGLATRIPITWSDNTASGAQPGDIIAYHWNSNEPDPQQVDHLALVSAIDGNGFPTVVQHSPAVQRFWSWDQGDAGRAAGWIQNVDRPDGADPTAWLIHINALPTY